MHQSEAFLFPGQKAGTHYTTRQMDTWFAKILKAAGIDQHDRLPNEEQAKSISAKKKKAPYDNKTELDSVTCLHTVPKHIAVFFG